MGLDLPLTIMPNTYDDYPGTSHYQIASGNMRYRDHQQVASWIDSTISRFPPDDDDVQFLLSGLSQPAGCDSLDPNFSHMTTSHSGMGSTCYDDLLPSDNVPYGNEQTYQGLPYSSVDVQSVHATLAPLETFQNQGYTANSMDSQYIPPGCSPDLTTASTVSTGAPLDDFQSGFSLPAPVVSGPSTVVNSVPIQECEYLGPSKFPVYRYAVVNW